MQKSEGVKLGHVPFLSIPDTACGGFSNLVLSCQNHLLDETPDHCDGSVHCQLQIFRNKLTTDFALWRGEFKDSV